MITGIYKIENLINHKSYIGQARDIYKRWRQHKITAFNSKTHLYNYPLYRSIRKYGLNNFKFEIIEECKVCELNEKEIFYIKKFDTFFNGYNQTLGGESTSVVDKQITIGIINDLENTNQFLREIAEKWHVSIDTVSGINTGRYWKQDRKYPIKTFKKTPVKTVNGKQIICDGHSKEKLFCKDCGAEITYKATRCVKCGQLNSRKCERPPKEDLYSLLKEHKNFRYVAKLFGVTDNAIKKWCKQYNIPHLVKDYVDGEDAKKKQASRVQKPIHMIDKKTNKVIKTFTSQKEAEIKLCGKYAGNITKVLSGKRLTAYGYKWAYADEDPNNT